MTDGTHLALSVVRAVVFLLGVAVTATATRAYHRVGEPYLRDAAVAFGVVTVGVLIEGVLFQFTSLDLTAVHLVESVAIGVGFLVLLRSLRA
ncbi:DUF7521 family protein [Halobaculum rubrum]|uniref:DUF7521 family protein n=1 Tax=Halobaculum rubrum TaxID=2872158 RepID=UPI001CA4687B|nr:hypothetical protein [Halobaculum rubrum]QZY00477.1 hypothetical protein K6T25_05145 [Halobaculum rubrum]